MAAILDSKPIKMETVLLRIGLLLSLAVHSINGACTLPPGWAGSWFQSGVPGLIQVNGTHIHAKGECAETESFDKFLLYDRTYDCFRCMVIHEKHESVLQYKETECLPKDSLSSICDSISGDAPLFSMFRKVPPPAPQPCPFRPQPFSFTYSRGSGECTNPPSRAESCTDDSRLLLRYMACPDVPGTESNVEELLCLASWKEGSTRYLVGRLTQVTRRNAIASDEDTYRCFIYKGQRTESSTTYHIAQSGDATCNGLSSPNDGSRTMKLTNSDDERHRCHFPPWIVEHHKWFSLDHKHQYHFTTKNATLKMLSEDGPTEEQRLVCHSILEHKDKRHMKLVAHVTRGCESGHACLTFHRRAPGVLQLRRAPLAEAAQDACSGPPGELVTLITTSLAPTRCPIAGRYSVSAPADRRRRRQQTDGAEAPECAAGAWDSVAAGCGASDAIEFRSHCESAVYTCFGSWSEGGTGYVVAAAAGGAGGALGGAGGGGAPRGARFCFVYTHHHRNESGGGASLALSAVRGSCDRGAAPALAGDRAYNLTLNGTCEQSSQYNSGAARVAGRAALTLGSMTVAMATIARR